MNPQLLHDAVLPLFVDHLNNIISIANNTSLRLFTVSTCLVHVFKNRIIIFVKFDCNIQDGHYIYTKLLQRYDDCEITTGSSSVTISVELPFSCSKIEQYIVLSDIELRYVIDLTDFSKWKSHCTIDSNTHETTIHSEIYHEHYCRN